jgi:hypothetical protein
LPAIASSVCQSIPNPSPPQIISFLTSAASSTAARILGQESPASQLPLIGGILGALLAIALIALVILLLIRRRKSDEDEAAVEPGSTEMDELTEYTPSVFEAELFAEYENMLDPEVQIQTFANGAFDEAGFGGLLPFGDIFGG